MNHEDHEVHKELFFLLVIFVIFVVLFSSGAAQQSAPVRSVWDGVYTAEQAKRGESLYAQHCSSCHGSTFEGGEMAPPLAGGAFNANWNGLSLGDLAERIRISMPQNNPGSLSRQQYVDILATMLGGGEFPQGKTELPREVDALKQIAFESAKRP
jgi:mono/diheme cytochrome c family protein